MNVPHKEAVLKVAKYLQCVAMGATKPDSRIIAGYSVNTREREILRTKLIKDATVLLKGKGGVLTDEEIKKTNESADKNAKRAEVSESLKEKKDKPKKVEKYARAVVFSESKSHAKRVAGYSEHTKPSKIESSEAFQGAVRPIVAALQKAGIGHASIADTISEMLTLRNKVVIRDCDGSEEVVDMGLNVQSADKAVGHLVKILGYDKEGELEAEDAHALSGMSNENLQTRLSSINAKLTQINIFIKDGGNLDQLSKVIGENI